MRVDHVTDYKPPKDNEKMDDETRQLQMEGCAPQMQLQPSQIKREEAKEDIVGGIRLPARLPIGSGSGSGRTEVKPESSPKVNQIYILLSIKLLMLLFLRNVGQKGKKTQEKQKSEKR